ncbi:MAG TPA: phage holin family protein [Vicinamibacterales bacterium]|nr:phage holin family protein [Vicinamibacterales bacterium]
MSFAIGLLLTAMLLQVLAAVVPGLEFDSLVATLGAALVISMVGWGTGLLYMAAASPLPGWAFVIIEIGINVLALLFASAVVSGMHVTGGAAVMTGVMLTILDHAIPILMTMARQGARGA